MNKSRLRFRLATLVVLVSITPFAIPNWRTPTAKIGEQALSLELASSWDKQKKGLMFRKSMPENHGMLFLFSPPRTVNFWMYHTLIPLDILFIENDKIVKVFHNVPPCTSEVATDCPRYGGIKASEVLELNGGYAVRHHVGEGDSIKFDRWFRLASFAELYEKVKNPLRPLIKLIRSK